MSKNNGKKQTNSSNPNANSPAGKPDSTMKTAKKDDDKPQTNNSDPANESAGVGGSGRNEGPLSPPASPRVDKRSLSKGSTDKKDKSVRIDAASTTGATAAQSTVTATASGGNAKERDPTAAAVTELLGTMQSTLGALGKTFDVLGEQTMKVAALGPAIDAMYQLRAVEGELEEQHTRQEEKMQDVKATLQERFRAHMREELRPQVNRIVADIVKREVEERVRRQLTKRIPASLREQLHDYKQQILQAKASLHNSEARRHNALIRGSGLDEPLKPLLRPLAFAPIYTGGDAGVHGQGNAGAGAGGKGQQKGGGKGKGATSGIPTPPDTTASASTASGARAGAGGSRRGGSAGAHPLSVDTDTSSLQSSSVRTSAAVTASSQGESSPTSVGSAVWDLEREVPTPSPLFPCDIAALVEMGEGDVKALVQAYGLAKDENGDAGRSGAGAGSGKAARPVSSFTVWSDAEDWAGAGLDGCREEDLNRFMRYIGVGFQVLPSSPVVTLGNGGGTAVTLRSPIVERQDYAFVR